MGMFDSFHADCPNCGHSLEFQSKSGACMLANYDKSNLPPVDTAVDLNGEVVRCQFCNKNILLTCNLPLEVKMKVSVTKKRYNYDGNYNSRHPDSIKNQKELAKIFEKESTVSTRRK